MTSTPFESLTLATFRMAELGFLGLVVYTRVQTPRLKGHSSNDGDLLFALIRFRPDLTNWFIVGKDNLLFIFDF